MRLVRLLLALAMLLPAPAGHAQEPAGAATIILRPGEDPARIARLVEELSRGGRAVLVRTEAPEAVTGAGAAAADAPSLPTAFVAGMRRGIEGLAAMPQLFRQAGAAWGANQNAAGSRAAGLILAVLAAAAVIALLVGGALRWALRDRMSEAPTDLLSRLAVAGLAGGRDAAALLAFAVGGHLILDRLLPLPDFARSIGEACLDGLATAGLYAVAGRFLLSPQAPARRLLPIAHPDWHWRMLLAYGFFGAFIVQTVQLAAAIGTDRAAVAGWFFLVGTLITAQKLWWFWGGRRDIAGLVRGDAPHPGAARIAAGWAVPALYVAVAVIVWMVGRVAAVQPEGARWGAAAGVTQILFIVLPILAVGAGALVPALTARLRAPGEASPGGLALAAVARVLAAGLVWVAGLAFLARLWAEYLVDVNSAGAVGALRALVAAGTAAMMGWTVWTFLRTYFDAHAPKPRTSRPGDEDEGEAPVRTRLATVLPLLRGAVLGAVVAVTVLVVLASLGLEIGPFLAGFGVIGLAFSFGSQALVRDIVSGIFFLADDAFRVGEYIDTGKLKGTVEKITLRSVQLRHQNGQIHTIPFGQLQATTNFSRDWATMKFTLRLDRHADIERARKTIKKVGEAMLADPELGPEFLLPLKMQGVQEIQDGAVVIRCKFTAKPNKPSYLQRQALKRIYAALNEAGVPLATNAVTVLGDGTRAGAAVPREVPAVAAA